MKVAVLCQSLEGLCQFLENSGAKQTANEWRRLKDALSAFAEPSVTDFCDFLLLAQEYCRTGKVPLGKTGAVRKPKAQPRSPESLAEAIQKVKDFYESVIRPEVTYEMITAEIERIEKDFRADELKELARQLGISRPPKTKKATLEEIQRRMIQRKETIERTNF